MRQRLPLMLAALWWGSATAVGAWVVPMLFKHLGTPAVAGAMAAQLFAAQTWVALLSGLMMLWAWHRPSQHPDTLEAHEDHNDSSRTIPSGADHRRADAWVLAGMLAAAVMTWGVSPRILAREQLALWHAVGSGFYALQWLAAGVTLWRQGRVSPGNAS